MRSSIEIIAQVARTGSAGCRYDRYIYPLDLDPDNPGPGSPPPAAPAPRLIVL
jgi:hypothetical protein